MKLRYSTIAATACFTLALMVLASKPAQSVSALISSPAQSLRVVSATLVPSPQAYDGKCPVTINFRGEITVKGTGTVKYTFIRSDGATGPIHSLDFDGDGTKPVETTWTLSPPTFNEWEAIKILSPNEMQSNRAFFKGTCLQQAAPDTSKGFIACPLKQARTEVTTPLPEPWWNTPRVGKLERVSVQTIGGNQTLVCEYWAYGRTVSIMRLFPAGTTSCTPAGTGFDCH